MRIVFGEWAPDQPAYLSSNVTTARNLFSGTNGYRPLKQFVPTEGGSLPGPCLGATSFTTPQGVSSIIAGTQTGLYRPQLNGWQLLASGYGLQTNGRWRFAQFGGIGIATNSADPMVKIDLLTTTVSILGGSPPKATNLAVVKDFLVATGLDGDAQTLGWSGINDAEWWTFGQNQSDYNIMPSGGEITGLFGGEVGIVLQRNRITRMDYVGDNLVFQFSEISSNVGCVSINSTAQWGSLGFFYSDAGFKMWDGAQIVPIGQERIDRYFKSLYTTPDLLEMFTAIDPLNSIVMWSLPNFALIYNWKLDRWTSSDADFGPVFAGVSRDVALDEMDSDYPVLDTITPSLDDAVFFGDDPRFYVFDSANRLGSLTGPTMETEIGVGMLELAQGRDARIRFVRPLSDIETGITLTIDARRRLGQAPLSTDYTYLNPAGDMPVRECARFASFNVTSAAASSWSYVQGIDVRFAPGAQA